MDCQDGSTVPPRRPDVGSKAADPQPSLGRPVAPNRTRLSSRTPFSRPSSRCRIRYPRSVYEARPARSPTLVEDSVNRSGLIRSPSSGASLTADIEIVARCRRGDATAWRAFYDRYVPVVYRFLSAFRVPSEEREDACQEVFVAIYRSLGRFRGKALLSTWIYRIAARHIGRRARRRRVRDLLSTLLMLEPPPPPISDQSDRSERLQILDELVGRLSPKKRLVLVLFEIEAVPIEEIAKIVGCP